MAAEMIQMLEGLNFGAMPQRFRERFEPRPRPRPMPKISIAPWSGPPPPSLGELSDTVMSIVKFGALTAAAGGLLYMGSRFLRRRIKSRRRRR